ncbi:uncharacterized protein [Dysidea avara]|uniref:uncharacterized protein n=1 Tax=Dysidea avara TaxID=196820 RepID=UPI00331D0491
MTTCMQTLLHFLIAIATVGGITVTPVDDIRQGNCSGKLDYFLCTCLSTNTTIDIHLSPGHYHFTQQSCELSDKNGVTITGSDVVIECNGSGFNIVFMNTTNIKISNITMKGCGGVFRDSVSQNFQGIVPYAYFGNGSRFVLTFSDSSDITINNLTMFDNLGYGILVWNTWGTIQLSHIQIVNTTFSNDPQCVNYDYSSEEADSTCSGSGILMIFVNSTSSKDTTVSIDDSHFENNVNIIPQSQLQRVSDLVSTAYYRDRVPIAGAGCISIYYIRNISSVTTTITNTIFHNNNGSYSATVAVTVLYSISGNTSFENCTFLDNNRMSSSMFENDLYSLHRRGGIVYLYLIVRDGITTPVLPVVTSTETRLLTLVRCTFMQIGGNMGASLYVEKISPDFVTIAVTIKECSFISNEADVGSAVYAKQHQFRVSLQSEVSGGIQFYFINVNATNNVLSQGSELDITSNTFVTGVFSFDNCRAFINCSQGCSFTGNQPSVFYGRDSGLMISGHAIFEYNKGTYGGGFQLLDTVLYIHTGTVILFQHNFGTKAAGAIDVYFPNTNIESEDICPIQFIGSGATIFELKDVGQLNVNISFFNNSAISSSSLQSIYADVFYVCSWYPDTLTQIVLGRRAPVINGRRQSVYRSIFNFYPVDTTDKHLLILAHLPCLCDEYLHYNATSCFSDQSVYTSQHVVPGRLFNLSIIALDVVGSVGFADQLLSEVYHTDRLDRLLALAERQYTRPFTIVNNTCAYVEFTVYVKNQTIPNNGTLEMSLSERQLSSKIIFNFDKCSIGFQLHQIGSDTFGCVCDDFFGTKELQGKFQCDASTGNITRLSEQSWLSVYDGDLEFVKICLPTYCHDQLLSFDVSEADVLCTIHHSGRACGGCVDDFSRVFGSDTCKKCNNIWLITILLYVVLGLVLIFLLFLLKLTVALGLINGLIFFCNMMSINEKLFFNTEISKYSFLRMFISLINLDLGIEICFYDGMSQLAKTGLQFVFPIYLWLLMVIIIYAGKHYIRSRSLSFRSAIPILATLILLSYLKILRTTVSVFSFDEVSSSTGDSIHVWLPDPNVKYLTGVHIVLFVIAFLFLLFFILPFVICFIFPRLVLRSKRLSYFFPMLDCFLAPYKHKYRFWFGLRALVLLYLSAMEAVIFSSREALLLSSIAVVGFFALLQAYVHPFKDKLVDAIDLIFMGIFLLLAAVTLYLYPSENGFEEVNIAVTVLGYVGFILFLVVIVYHVYDATKHTQWNIWLTKLFWVRVTKYCNKGNNFLPSTNSVETDFTSYSGQSYNESDGNSPYVRFQESFLEQI